MTENNTRDERSPENSVWADSAEVADSRNFELDSEDEPRGSGGFRIGGPAVDPYADEAEYEEEATVETSDAE